MGRREGGGMRTRRDDGDDLRHRGRPGRDSPPNGPDGADRTAASTARERLPWFKWFPGDWLAETQGWPLLARGVYRELLDAQWNMGVLPAEPSRLRKLVGATPREWRVAWPFVSSKFPTVPGGRLHPGLEDRRRQAYAQR